MGSSFSLGKRSNDIPCAIIKCGDTANICLFYVAGGAMIANTRFARYPVKTYWQIGDSSKFGPKVIRYNTI